MANKVVFVVEKYLGAFKTDGSFVEYLSVNAKKELEATWYSRREVLALARKGAGVLRSHLGAGECCLHFFTDNRFEDLVFRLASVLVGSVPVTVNWQSDDAERVRYKASSTGAKLCLVDKGLPAWSLPLKCLDAREALEGSQSPSLEVCETTTTADTRIIIFTSGTTGMPKGVRLSYGAYDANRETFEDFLMVGEGVQLDCVVTNPFHHTNTTAITDWALRRPGSKLRLLQRYTTAYWSVVAAAARRAPFGSTADLKTDDDAYRVVCPLVSRHIDFLDDLCARGKLPVPSKSLASSRGVVLLLGSAPVGPTTVDRLERLVDSLPVVRFGSTETCLQVAGTPLAMTPADRLERFRRGWEHSWRGQATVGYYIGRDHAPLTEVRVVRSVESMEDCDDGEPGYLVTRGDNLMSGYVGNPDATAKAFSDDGWYLNLGDVGFRLGKDLYWYSRDSAMLIRGGANYAYEQINAELVAFVARKYALVPKTDFDLAVVGIKIQSEHEDSCCVTLELKRDDIDPPDEQAFLAAARDAGVSKGAKPDKLRVAPLPRNFKGVVLIPDLVKAWKAHLLLL
ncbi:hypothetical protein CTAYLR_004840 [Chrysophaeum taylorii]|uniref:AMP-dependent synthetase/ligase domain-containing protein n=1 Tax=Chrysophaeum taylorii TaxID=2483200 RepID=A0AAD7XPI1_9STRA|nr:hypothetical protein CTAYLR_004840 [Chrysophaeum taylorii]